MSSGSSGIRRIPIVTATLCLSGIAVTATIVLSLISLYLPNRGAGLTRSTLCQVSFAPMVSQFSGNGPDYIATADFDKDGFLDLVVVNYLGNTTTVFLGTGNGAFTQHSNLSNGNNVKTTAIATGDLTNDGQMDIVITNIISINGNIMVFLGEGNGSFSEITSLSSNVAFEPLGLALGALGTDNTLDLVVSDSVTSGLLIFRGNGDGTFTEAQTLSTGSASVPYLVIINYFNKDTYLDIAVANYGANNVGVFLGNSTGNFGTQTTYATEAGPYSLVAADFNRDGVLDIATGNYLGNSITILLGNGDGTFRTHKSFSTGSGSLPGAIRSADFNRDNIKDLIVANSGIDNVGIFLGYGNGNFRTQMTYSTGNGSIPSDIVVSDFNQDNRLDFISTNYGTKTIGIFLSTCSRI